MKSSKFSESQIISILKQQDTGVKVADICREHGISQATFYKWLAQDREGYRRSAIEPKIGQAKQDNRLGRCYLKGLAGDAMKVILSAAGANLAKLLRLLPCAERVWLMRWRSRFSSTRINRVR